MSQVKGRKVGMDTFDLLVGIADEDIREPPAVKGLHGRADCRVDGRSPGD
jgi:hypothetical protein